MSSSFFLLFFFSSDFSRANELQLDVLFFKSTGSSGSSISPSRTFARSLAASYPFLLHPKTKKTFHKAGSSSSSQEALVPATRRSNRRRTAVAEEGGGRRREEELTAKETQRDRDREKHTLDLLPH
jgi:hypothetical protein